MTPTAESHVIRPLTRASLLDGVRALVDQDRALARIVERHGAPPLWSRPRGFATLTRIILEQQVSLASGAAMYARIDAALGGLSPTTVALVGRTGLQTLGVTRQKAAYIAALAEQVESGALPLDSLGRLPDERAAELLVAVPGIGPWTASIYLLMALRRPDVWPPGDLALHKALARLRRRQAIPTSDEARAFAARWRPWRAVAARILWHAYLSDRAA